MPTKQATIPPAVTSITPAVTSITPTATNVVLATNNQHKLKELSAILAAAFTPLAAPFNLPFNLLSQQQLNIPSAPELGTTFVENAISKARHACNCSGYASIADDSGLVVDALHGAPGICSARYAATCAATDTTDAIAAIGAPSSKNNCGSNNRNENNVENHNWGDSCDKKNIAKLLHELRSVPTEQRSARFYCVIVYLRHAHDPAPIICQGIWEGKILCAPQGENGFGYDPLFWVAAHNCSAAELPATVKNRISHRAQALQQLAAILQDHLKTSLQN